VQEHDPGPEQPDRAEHERQHQDDHRPEVPRHLGEPDEAPSGLRGRELADQREGRGHVGAHGNADDERAGEEHHRVHSERDQQDAQRVHEQVPLVDPLAAELVAEPPADERADRTADGVRPDRREGADAEVRQAELRLEQREPGAQRHDRAGVEVGRHRGERRPLPLLPADRAVVLAGVDPHGVGCGHDALLVLVDGSTRAGSAVRGLKRIKGAG
jgi:hypothetical protein